MPAPEVEALLLRAREDLQAARHSLSGGFVRAALNRAYHSALQAARAALLGKGESPKTHTGVRNRLGLCFVLTGDLAPEIAEILNTAETLRNQADYEALAVFDERGAEDLLRDVERFVMAVERLIA